MHKYLNLISISISGHKDIQFKGIAKLPLKQKRLIYKLSFELVSGVIQMIH